MALPSSGTITMAQIATEIGVALPISLTQSNVRTLCQVSSGTVTLPTHFYGKSWKPALNLTYGFIAGAAVTDTVVPATASGSDTVNVTAGTAPYTYSWTVTGVASKVGLTTNTLGLSFSSKIPQTVTGTYYCTVTGANGASANTAVCNYSLEISSL